MSKDFTDYVAIGRELVQARDTNSWALGDLLVDATRELDIKPGRPTDPDALTLGDMAREWDVETARASAWLSNAEFYPANVRTFPLSWSHYDLARRHADGKLDNALELLDRAAAQAFGIRDFRRYVKGEYFEGPVSKEELPARLRALIPASVGSVWIVIRQDKEAA